MVLFEPRRDDYRMFFTNIFSFSARQAVCEHAYLATRRDLLRARRVLGPVLARHGMHLRHDVLADEERTVWDGLRERRNGHSSADVPTDTLSRLAATLDRLEGVLDTT